MIIVALFAPYKYVIKGTYAAGGFVFWFAPNLWAALPLEHRSRIPPPLGDVPTDAEYAMSIISQRVDRGENVLPPERRKKDKKSSSTTNLSTTSIGPSNTFSSTNRSTTTIGSNVDDQSFVTVNNKPKGFTAKVVTAGLTNQSKRKESLDENGDPLPEQSMLAMSHMIVVLRNHCSFPSEISREHGDAQFDATIIAILPDDVFQRQGGHPSARYPRG